MKIRTLLDGDLQSVAQIAEANDLFPSAMLDQMSKPFLANQSPDDLWLVAETDNQVRGFCFASVEEMTEGTWNMLALAVAPSHHSLGIGSAIVNALESRLKNANACIMIVDTSSDDNFAGARKFYQSCGYREEARIRSFWSEGDDKVTYWKRLN